MNHRIFLKLNGTKIYESLKIKYLGVILDTRLRWNHHINELSKKLNRALGLVYKIRHDCTKNVLLSLYYSLFHSHLSYGLTVWGKSNESYLSAISVVPKKIIRAITFSDFNAHTAPIFKDLGILALKELCEYKTVALMWDFDHDTLPNSLASLFNRRKDMHNHNLRSSSKNMNKVKELPFYEFSNSKFTFLKKYKLSILATY